MSASLRKATRGLITSVVQGNDLVPHLSLGVLHDLQAVALAIKNDNIDAKMEIRQRLWAALQDGLARSWYSNSVDDDGGDNNNSGRGGSNRQPGRRQGGGGGSEDDTWAFAALKTLRANMMSTKLLPPGEVLTMETTRVMRRDAFIRRSPSGGGSNNRRGGAEETETETGFYGVCRPARRVVLKYVRDVETRFREVRFAGTMLTDHSPARYEDALSLLQQGVLPS
ncbi:hypothetical protein MAPG_10599 [Magnaporthiopsis poae ATCC 64411]|uniref:Uncharacterized protein n=1 Tax=Magnaporthiopsis poae (strain ATCC 64411 / 73-15) TaxID=644358 RepID=A0A0C4ED08_MAGP6|nr:hypothetical protein MAPG_10599 [Magnaporthiopsis poae ATCC 64411]